MRLLTANKILLASCLVVVPVSIYTGIAIKERSLEKELETQPEASKSTAASQALAASAPSPTGPAAPSGPSTPAQDRAVLARVAQLEKERNELLAERHGLDIKIDELRQRVAGQKGSERSA